MKVVITGGTKGIGRAIAEKFAAAGCHIVTCSRSGGELQQLASELTGKYPGISVDHMVADLGKKSQAQAFGHWIISSGFLPDIIVNNAGYFAPGTISHEEDGAIEKMVAANLYSAYHLTRLLLPGMVERQRGHIFNICSVASFQPMATVGSYGISKFALLGFTKHLREEMKPHNIKVTAVQPGATMSASWAGSGIPADRILEASDIADMVVAASKLSPSAVVEDIIIRPQLGDV